MYLRETRIRRAVLYLPDGTGWIAREWNYRRPSSGLFRYPVFQVDRAELSGTTLYLSIETPGSMRARLWLAASDSFIAEYARQSLLLGGVFGLLLTLFIYLVTAGIALREHSLVALAMFVLTYLGYAIGDQGVLETDIWFGATLMSRMFSFSGSIMIFAWFLLYQVLYLRVPQYFPGIGALVGLVFAILIACSFEAVRELLVGGPFWMRFVNQRAGMALSAGQIGLACLMFVREPRRVVLFLLCWTPRIVGSNAHMASDVFPSIGTDTMLIHTNLIGNTISLMLFAVANSLDLRTRERALHAALQGSEERFRSFAASASDSFWEIDSSGKLTFELGPTSRRIGLSTGRRLADILRSVQPSAGHGTGLVESALRSREPFRALEAKVLDRDGNVLRLAFSGSPVRDHDGAYLGCRGIVADVTMETSRREREAQQQKVVAVGQLAAGVAHEINNLLHPIINLSRRVAAQFPSQDERRRYLDIVIEAGTRAGEIVKAVLGTVGQSATDEQPVPLAEATRRALDSLRPMLPGSVACEAVIQVEGGPLVAPGEVIQVLSNLVSNAVYATGSTGTITVTVSGGVEHGRDVHRLIVQDDGQGMSETTLQRAMEPFFTTKGPGEGTGLGLSIVYGLVQAWGARIDIESELGRGTRIIIRWPGSEHVDDRQRQQA